MNSEEDLRVETKEERVVRLVDEALKELQAKNKSIYAIAIETLQKNVKALESIKELLQNDKV